MRRLWLWVGTGAVVAAGAIAAVLALADRAEQPAAPVGADAGAARDAVGSQATSPATPASDAARLVEAAQAEAAAGRYLPAHALYRRAYELDPKPSTLLELGVLEHRTGHCREALRTAQRVVAAAPDRELADRAQQLLATIGRCD
jgi:tetratricopeptide (TPR) repeat protein